MPTALDFLKAKVEAYKHTLEGKSNKEKDNNVAIAIAQQFNSFLDEIKKKEIANDVFPLPPQPITWTGFGTSEFQLSDIKFLESGMNAQRSPSRLELVLRHR